MLSQPAIKKKKSDIETALPKQITVLGKVFKIVVTNLKGCLGDCNEDKAVIRIHQSQTVDSAKSVLFHEAVHAALAVSAQNQMLREDQEEALVRLIETAFFPIVDINKLDTTSK